MQHVTMCMVCVCVCVCLYMANTELACYWSSWHDAARDSEMMREFLGMGAEDRFGIRVKGLGVRVKGVRWG